MLSFRRRRALILPSTLAAAFLFNSGLSRAQSQEAWPFDDPEHYTPRPQSAATVQPASQKPVPQTPVAQNPVAQNPGAPSAAPQPKSAVQRKLEELYRRDGRPLPDYMQPDGSASGYQQPPQAPSPWVERATQPAAPIAAYQYPPANPPAYGPPGSVRQQLADYYASQGKTMPGTQPRPSAQPQPGYATAPSAPQPTFLERINPFRSMWRKDDPPAPPSTAVSSGNIASQTAASPDAGQYGQTPRPSAQPAISAPARDALYTVEGPTSPPTVALQPSAVSPHALSPYPQPSVAAPSDLAASAVISSNTPASASATGAPDAAACQPPASSPGRIAVVQSEQGSPQPSKPSEDKKSSPYTGLPIDDGQDEPGAPDPKKYAPATPIETAQRPSPAPTPAIDLKPSTSNVGEPYQAATQPHRTLAPALPDPPAAQVPARLEGNHLAQDAPPRPQHADPGIPKAFNERQTHAQPIRGPEETALRMRKIAERVAQKGLKGFCPVVLREQQDLVDAIPVYSSVYQSRRYYFSSAEAQARFEREPSKYAPVAAGNDVVVKAASDQLVEGTLDYAAWYKDRLFLFSSPESLDAFSLNPLAYAGPYLKSH